MTKKTTRRSVLAGIAGGAAALPALAAVPTGGTDGDLLSDVARWHALHDRIDALIDERARRLATVPKRFQDCGVDPRGITTCNPRGWGCAYQELVAYEGLFIAAGLGEVNDRLEDLFDEADPILARLVTASPSTVCGKAALVGVLHRDLNVELFRDPDNDDWDAKLAFKARDLLAELAEGGAA